MKPRGPITASQVDTIRAILLRALERTSCTTSSTPSPAGRVFGYARVSSDAQEDGTSLAAQREEIERYCRDRGLSRPSVCIEVESAGEENIARRIELGRLTADVRPRGHDPREQNGSVVARPSALGGQRARAGSNAASPGVRSVRASTPRRPTGIDRSASCPCSPDMERQKIKERTVGSRRRLRALGFHVEGQAPLGYKLGGGRGKWKLVIDQETSPIIVRMFALCLDGHSTREIAATLHGEHPHVRGMDHAAVHHRLADRRYIGESNTIGARGRRKPIGEWRVTHEALISAETFARAQEAMAANRIGGRPPSGETRTACFMLRGLMTCATCGHRISAHSPESGASITHGGYYQCVADKCVRARYADVDAMVEAEALAHLEALAARLASAGSVPRAEVDHGAKRAALVKRLARVQDGIEDGTFTKDEGRERVAKLRAEIAACDAQPTPAPTLMARALDVEAIRAAWSIMSGAERNAVVGELVERVGAGEHRDEEVAARSLARARRVAFARGSRDMMPTIERVGTTRVDLNRLGAVLEGALKRVDRRDLLDALTMTGDRPAVTASTRWIPLSEFGRRWREASAQERRHEPRGRGRRST